MINSKFAPYCSIFQIGSYNIFAICLIVKIVLTKIKSLLLTKIKSLIIALKDILHVNFNHI